MVRDYLRVYNLLNVGTCVDVLKSHRRQCAILFNLEPRAFLSKTLLLASFGAVLSASRRKIE